MAFVAIIFLLGGCSGKSNSSAPSGEDFKSATGSSGLAKAVSIASGDPTSFSR
jgi:hypothetical protein